jgi:hypothetical protein
MDLLADKCDKCLMSTAKHCDAASCSWRRCIRCRAFGVKGSMHDYDPAPKLEELYAMPTISVADRNPPLLSSGD